jgi:ABC-type amino acid transport substrate-binding protein
MEMVDKNKKIVGFDIDFFNAVARRPGSRSNSRTPPGTASSRD